LPNDVDKNVVMLVYNVLQQYLVRLHEEPDVYGVAVLVVPSEQRVVA
jgi:hypothetical protein